MTQRQFLLQVALPTAQASPEPENCIRLPNSPFPPTPSFTKRPGWINTALWRKADLNASLYLTMLTTLRSIFANLHVTLIIAHLGGYFTVTPIN